MNDIRPHANTITTPLGQIKKLRKAYKQSCFSIVAIVTNSHPSPAGICSKNKHRSMHIECITTPQSEIKNAPHMYAGRFCLTGVADGARTHDNRNHNPGLYQLSYSHHRTVDQIIFGLPDRNRTCDPQLRRLLLYPTELRADFCRQCKYGRSGGIRTRDPLVPNQMRYQTALRSEK